MEATTRKSKERTVDPTSEDMAKGIALGEKLI